MKTEKRTFQFCSTKEQGKSNCCKRLVVRTNVKAGAETEEKKPVEPYVVKLIIPHDLV